MPRPCCCRRISCRPAHMCFKPRGVPMAALGEINLGLDELEAIRLVDLEGLYHEEAALRMNVSRPTLTRIVESARRKVAGALVEGKALIIEGGNIMTEAMRGFHCADCGHHWEVAHGTARPDACPECGSGNIHRSEECMSTHGHGGGHHAGGHGRKGRGHHQNVPEDTGKKESTQKGESK